MPLATVSSKGWVVIPAELRKKYDLKAGSQVIMVDYGGVLAIVPAMSDAVKESYGLLKSGASLTKALLAEHAEESKRAG
jgi:AbrB family looped-hinge helix DNA binding protein